jgi:hypothetical protein
MCWKKSLCDYIRDSSFKRQQTIELRRTVVDTIILDLHLSNNVFVRQNLLSMFLYI